MELQGGGVAALRRFLAANLRAEKLDKAEIKQLVSGNGEPEVLTPSELRLAVQLLRELRAQDSTVPSAANFLRSKAQVVAIDASRDAASQVKTDKQVAYMEKRRQKLLRLDEEMRYGGMIRNVKGTTASREMQEFQTSVKQHLSIGANMVVARITAFVAVYMVARSLTDSETTVSDADMDALKKAMALIEDCGGSEWWQAWAARSP